MGPKFVHSAKESIDRFIAEFNIFKKEIFPLYSSFKGGVEGKLVNSDKRQNTLSNKRIWIIAGVAIIGGFFAARNNWKYFNPTPPPTVAAKTPAKAPNSPAGKPKQLVDGLPDKTERPAVSETWRVVGRFSANDRYWRVLSDNTGRVRLVSPSLITGDGMLATGTIDGSTVSVWTGTISERMKDGPKLPDIK
ncbi:hypothetical protein ACO0LM_00640 [Undibacterium sp. Di26W]|uniref:hypothetical protein n=1 Tax=Undibacterium sp. Di26W TaxID=3413035 RepID=UPI003BEFF355